MKQSKAIASSFVRRIKFGDDEKIIEETKAELPKQLSSVEETSKALDDIYKANPNKIEKLLGEDVVYHGTKNEFDEFNENSSVEETIPAIIGFDGGTPSSQYDSPSYGDLTLLDGGTVGN